MRVATATIVAVLALAGCDRHDRPVARESAHPAVTDEENEAAGLTVLSVENCLDGQGSDETVRYGDRSDAIRVARIGRKRYRVELLRLVGKDGIDAADFVVFEQRVDRPPGKDGGFYPARPLDDKTVSMMQRGGCGP
jgi:hypothetical protein